MFKTVTGTLTKCSGVDEPPKIYLDADEKPYDSVKSMVAYCRGQKLGSTVVISLNSEGVVIGVKATPPKIILPPKVSEESHQEEQPIGETPDIQIEQPIETPPKNEQWDQERIEFKRLISSIDRKGIPELLKYLEDSTDFYVAPSSTEYHDNVEGGLLHHSLKVYKYLLKLSKTFKGDYPDDSLKIIGLLHDLCKVNFYKLEVKQLPKLKPDGEPELNEYGQKIWVPTKRYVINDQLPLGHGEKSVMILQDYIHLTEIEKMGVRWHMMSYDDLHYSYAGNKAITTASDKYPIIVLMHLADLSASFIELRDET